MIVQPVVEPMDRFTALIVSGGKYRNPPKDAKVWLTNWPVPPTQGCAQAPGEAEAEAECGEGGGGQQRGVEVAAVHPRHGQRGDQRAQAHHHLTLHF